MRYNLAMKIIKFDEIDSTNTYAKKNIEILDDKTVVSADFQTQGHGRFTRSWVDLGKENVYMSFILKPSKNFKPVYVNLTQYLSVVLCKQFEEMGLKPEIKWPNDVLINGKKNVGILCETVMRGNNFNGLVLGVGVNLNASKEYVERIDRPATALSLELGHVVSKNDFIEKLFENFFLNYDEFLEKGFTFIKEDYLNRTNILGKNLNVSIWDTVISGIAKEIDDCGNLVLELPNGEIKNINMGEIV